jgi:hypothetical protein
MRRIDGSVRAAFRSMAKNQLDGGIRLLVPVVAAAVLALKMPPAIPKPQPTNPN